MNEQMSQVEFSGCCFLSLRFLSLFPLILFFFFSLAEWGLSGSTQDPRCIMQGLLLQCTDSLLMVHGLWSVWAQ